MALAAAWSICCFELSSRLPTYPGHAIDLFSSRITIKIHYGWATRFSFAAYRREVTLYRHFSLYLPAELIEFSGILDAIIYCCCFIWYLVFSGQKRAHTLSLMSMFSIFLPDLIYFDGLHRFEMPITRRFSPPAHRVLPYRISRRYTARLCSRISTVELPQKPVDILWGAPAIGLLSSLFLDFSSFTISLLIYLYAARATIIISFIIAAAKLLDIIKRCDDSLFDIVTTSLSHSMFLAMLLLSFNSASQYLSSPRLSLE